ncbi:MAG: hypothetical protein NZ108_04760 [Bacteroidia bacterium]|nr:hypothetical protein [Bacteroidia bacterium]
MKSYSSKILLAIASFSLNLGIAFAQNPQFLNYQAVARDAIGTALPNQAMAVRVSIVSGSTIGPVLYTETHSVTTNSVGLFSVKVGQGTVNNGNFSTINWSSAPMFMKVELDANGTGAFVDLGTTALASVPYAFIADSARKAPSSTVITANPLTGTGTVGSPLTLINGNAVGQVLQWNGSAWNLATISGGGSGDNWGTQTAVTNATLTGNGTVGSPLGLAQQGATVGQVLQWNGTSWVPATITGGSGSVSVTTPLIGNGTSGSPITFAPGSAAGQVYQWNGSAWTLATISGSSGWSLTGNAATNPAQNFLGTTDNQDLVIRTNNTEKVRITSAGRMGIGTASPSPYTRLHVTSTNRYAGFFTSDSNSAVTTVVRGEYVGGQNDGIAFWGRSNPAPGYGIGSYMAGGYRGAAGVAEGGNYSDATDAVIGVFGSSIGTAGWRIGVYAQASAVGTGTQNYGVLGIADTGDVRVGVFGFARPITNSFAGYFNGNVTVTGTLAKAGGTFKIDHPQDPANKYLVHSFVESPDMMNIYNGNIITDANGYAEIEMPSYFEALNKDFRYQLTPIGQAAQVYVAKELDNGRFAIQADKPTVKISWQVTGIRKDPWANQNRVVVEPEKSPQEKGKYLHPELYGQPSDKTILPAHTISLDKHNRK